MSPTATVDAPPVTDVIESEVIPESEATESRFDLGALLQRASDAGVQPRNLTPETVLGLSSEDVQRLRGQVQAQTTVPGQLSAEITLGWSRARLIAESTAYSHLLRLRSTGQRATRRRVNSAIADAARQRHLRLVIEECRLDENSPNGLAAPARPSTELADAGYVHLLVGPSSRFEGSARIGRRAAARDAGTPSDGERLIRIGDTVVAQVSEDGINARLFVHPFLTPQGQLTAAGAEARAETLGRIVEAILPLLPARATQDAEVSADNDQVLRDAVATLDLLPGFVAAVGDRTAERRSALDQRLESQARDVERLRQELMDATRAKAQLEADKEALERSASSLSMVRITEALVQVQRIRTRLRAVRSVTLASVGTHPAISIVLHPLVMEYNQRRYLLDKLAFTLQLDVTNPQPQWASIALDGSSPHPHVSSSNGTTCWGHAQVPVSQALERKDFAATVMHIIGWASQYNPSSPYVNLNSGTFPRTDLAPGWHPELPVRV